MTSIMHMIRSLLFSCRDTAMVSILFFRDTDERFIVKKTSIKKIDGDYATIVIGAKHRPAEIEVQGIYHRPSLSLNELFSHL